MKILFLTHRLPYAPNRGDRIRAYYLLKEMSRFASVSLFSLLHDDDEALRVRDVPFATRVMGARVTTLANYARGAVRLLSRRPLTHSLLDAPSARETLEQLVAAESPDLVVAFCSSMARFAMGTPLATSPFVLDMVDVDSVKWGELAQSARLPLRWIYQREAGTLGAFEAIATAQARATLVVNEREHHALQAIAPAARIHLMPNGIDVASFTPSGPPAEGPVVCFCGVMDYAPNAEGVRWFAEQVWPRVRASRSDARFVVIGGGVTSATRALAVNDSSIEIVGRVPSVQPHLWRSAMAVAPLRLARGLQNKVLEALAAGLPVVVTPAVFEGLPLEARPGCDAATDPADFAAAVVRSLNASPAARRQRAASGQLDRLTWADRLSGLEAILHEAAAGRP